MTTGFHDGERLTLTVEEAARLLGVGRRTAYEAVRTGALPSVRLGRRILIPRKALLVMLEQDGCPDESHEH